MYPGQPRHGQDSVLVVKALTLTGVRVQGVIGKKLEILNIGDIEDQGFIGPIILENLDI